MTYSRSHGWDMRGRQTHALHPFKKGDKGVSKPSGLHSLWSGPNSWPASPVDFSLEGRSQTSKCPSSFWYPVSLWNEKQKAKKLPSLKGPVTAWTPLFVSYLLNCFRMHWIFTAVPGWSLVTVSGGYSLVPVHGASHCGGFSYCGAWTPGHLGFSSRGTLKKIVIKYP